MRTHTPRITIAIGNVQRNDGPAVASPNPNVVKTAVVAEMSENAMQNEPKRPIARFSRCS